MNRLKGRFAAQQILGGRTYQQDDYGLIERGDPDMDGSEVLVLADGMGGYFGGDIASKTEEARHPYQDNTTVLLYRPEADCGEGMLPEEPR